MESDSDVESIPEVEELRKLTQGQLTEDVVNLESASRDTSGTEKLPAVPSDSLAPQEALSQLRHALTKNREYQVVLKEQLAKLESARSRNANLKKKMQHFAALQAKTIRNKSLVTQLVPKRGLAASWFVDTQIKYPPDNADTERKFIPRLKMPLVYKYKQWNDAEVVALEKGVKQYIQQQLLDPLLKNPPRDNSVLEAEISRISKLSNDELSAASEGIEIDWDNLAASHVVSRTGKECQQMWDNVLAWQINRSEWSKEEDKRLLALANHFHGTCWEQIAANLGNNRTALQCFKRYQRSLNTTMLRSTWTAEEDAILTDAVKQYGTSNWQQVSNLLEGRTGMQCMHRWMKTLRPDIRRTRWTPDEDMMLLMAHHAYGGRWHKMAPHIPNRSDVQCRERYVNVLNPVNVMKEWTAEEDEKLQAAIETHGLGKWSKIAEVCHPRTDNQCWRRWQLLSKGETLDQYKQNVLKKQKGLVRNFTGRSAERSLLTADDFDIDEEELAQELQIAQSKKKKGTAAAADPDQPKKKRGRPPGSKNKAKKGEAEEEEEAQETEEESDAENAKKKKKRAPAKRKTTTKSKAASSSQVEEGEGATPADATTAPETAPTEKKKRAPRKTKSKEIEKEQTVTENGAESSQAPETPSAAEGKKSKTKKKSKEKESVAEGDTAAKPKKKRARASTAETEPATNAESTTADQQPPPSKKRKTAAKSGGEKPTKKTSGSKKKKGADEKEVVFAEEESEGVVMSDLGSDSDSGAPSKKKKKGKEKAVVASQEELDNSDLEFERMIQEAEKSAKTASQKRKEKKTKAQQAVAEQPPPTQTTESTVSPAVPMEVTATASGEVNTSQATTNTEVPPAPAPVVAEATVAHTSSGRATKKPAYYGK